MKVFGYKEFSYNEFLLITWYIAPKLLIDGFTQELKCIRVEEQGPFILHSQLHYWLGFPILFRFQHKHAILFPKQYM